MIWQFKGLIMAFLFDAILDLNGVRTAFSIGWLIAMIIDYKDIKKELNYGVGK